MNDFNNIISNVKIYDLEESCKASGYPKVTHIEDAKYSEKRVMALGTSMGGGHDQFLTGIRVNFDLTLSNKAWVEAERYRFLEFVSSQSTMHRISKFNIADCCNEYVDSRVIDIVNELKDKYNETNDKEDYLKLLYNVPAGFKITARMTTNYRCLLNIYMQRKNHKLPEWRGVCDWIKSLPLMENIIDEVEKKQKEQLAKNKKSDILEKIKDVIRESPIQRSSDDILLEVWDMIIENKEE